MHKHFKNLGLVAIGIFILAIFASNKTYALTGGVDLALQASFSGFPEGSNAVLAQYSSPTLKLNINNMGDTLVSATNITPGFVECTRIESNLNIYKSNLITSFVANPGIPQNISIILKDIFTQAVGTKTITCSINKNASYYPGENKNYLANNVWSGSVEVVEANRFDLAMQRAIEPIKNNLEAPEVQGGLSGPTTIKNFIQKKVMDILVPLVIVIGILSAILGFYKMLFSDDENSTKEGVKYLLYGIIGIIIMMSAKFIGQNFFDLLNPASGEIKGYEIASGLYDKILYPFVKLAIYLVLGVMFIILTSRVVTFIFGTDEEAKKKAGTIIGRNIIAMIIIIGAKQIVEAIYGKQATVIKDVSNLGQIGTGILADKNIPILYQVINWAMGLASLAVLIIIIFQTIQLLTKPDSPEQMKSIKNSLLYIFIGLLVIGAGYLITNFLIFN